VYLSASMFKTWKKHTTLLVTQRVSKKEGNGK
jgi:hypothetical protein